MRWGPFLDRFWRRPPTREARNEQKKASAALIVNPALADSLMLWHRVLLVGEGLWPILLFAASSGA
jgi:hypothetical protein